MNKEELDRIFGDKVAKIRRERGMTQTDLGFAIQKDRETITRIEAGRMGVTLYTAILIAKALGVTINDLTTFE